MDRERGNSLPLPSTVTKFHRRNAISGPSSTSKLLMSNKSSASSQAVEEDDADLHFGNGGGSQGREMRDEEPDEKSESKRDILWQGSRKLIMRRPIWVFMALAFTVMIGYYLPLLRLLRSDHARIASLQLESTSCQEDCQASSGEALRYQIVNCQRADSMNFLFCREGVNADSHIADSSWTPVPVERNSSSSCPAYGIRGAGAQSSWLWSKKLDPLRQRTCDTECRIEQGIHTGIEVIQFEDKKAKDGEFSWLELVWM